MTKRTDPPAPPPPGCWPVPDSVEVRGDLLVWSRGTPGEEGERLAAASPRLLDDFLWATLGPPDELGPEVAAFAAAHGVLGRCPHGRRVGRCPEAGCRDAAADRGAEPLASWRTAGERAWALRTLAGDLRRGERGDTYAWRDVVGEEEAERLEGMPALRAGWARALEEGFLRDEVAPGLEWSGAGTRLRFAPTSLLGALGVRLLREVVAADDEAAAVGGLALASCAGCGTPVRPERPSPGRRAYCPRCRDRGAPQRDAARAYRARRRSRAAEG